MNPGLNSPHDRLFFSVVVPLYNKRRFVRRSIDSILAQTWQNFEILVIDDGSTDGSAEVVRHYHDTRVCLFQQSNRGVGAARNRGIADARGAWIAFLDADDEWMPDFLESVADAARRSPHAGAVYGLTRHVRGGVEVKPVGDWGMDPRVVDYFTSFTRDNGPEMNSSSTAVRRDVFKMAGLFPEDVSIGEDTDMWLRVAWTTEVVLIPRIVSIYHRDASASNWQRNRPLEPHWFATYRAWRRERRIPPHLEKASAAYYQDALLARALRLARMRKRLRAILSLVRGLDVRNVPRGKLVKTVCRICLPEALVEAVKRV